MFGGMKQPMLFADAILFAEEFADLCIWASKGVSP
jgi:hypothetical protein